MPGDYTLDLIVKDKQSGKMTARREQLVLPELNNEFATTPIVLSRYVEAASELPATSSGLSGCLYSPEDFDPASSSTSISCN